MSGAVISGPGPSPSISLAAGGSGSLTSSALVTGGGGGTLQTPSSTSTLDSSGNMSISGTFRMTANGALSSGAGPAFQANGTWVTGGSATTTKPYFLLETTGATSTGWNTNGTGLGINAASGFVGFLIDAQLNGSSSFSVSRLGQVTAAGSLLSGDAVRAAATGHISWNGRAGGLSPADGKIVLGSAGLTGFGTLALGATAPATIGALPANGQTFSILQATELLTIAAAASTTTTMLVPAGAIVLSVSVRVTTIIPTAATFTVTIGGVTFNTVAVPVAATTTNMGTAAGASYLAAATGVTITPNLTPGAATGVVRITCTYLLVTPPTS